MPQKWCSYWRRRIRAYSSLHLKTLLSFVSHSKSWITYSISYLKSEFLDSLLECSHYDTDMERKKAMGEEENRNTVPSTPGTIWALCQVLTANSSVFILQRPVLGWLHDRKTALPKFQIWFTQVLFPILGQQAWCPPWILQHKMIHDAGRKARRAALVFKKLEFYQIMLAWRTEVNRALKASAFGLKVRVLIYL